VEWLILIALVTLPIVLLLAHTGCQFTVRGFVPFGSVGDIPVQGKYLDTMHTRAALFRPSQGLWMVLDVSVFDFINGTDDSDLLPGLPPGVGHVMTFPFGAPGDLPVAGDYFGTGTFNPAIFRPSDGTWQVAHLSFDPGTPALTVTHIDSFASPFAPGEFSASDGDAVLPPADYLLDGSRTVAAFKARLGEWHIRNLATQANTLVSFGAAGNVAVPGDYFGDGIVRLAVLDTALASWRVFDLPTKSEILTFPVPFVPGDVPLAPARWQGAGDKPDVALFRPSDGNYLLLTRGGILQRTVSVTTQATPKDLPAPGDYDGIGVTEEVIFRGGNWERADFTVIGG
jgi:hypothetical protein